MWQENGMKVKEHLCFMHDALKNVTSIFDEQQKQKIRYGYLPSEVSSRKMGLYHVFTVRKFQKNLILKEVWK